uniref:Uncharacterized protein n=1 Tax=Avena sativa TaxID=4498 RepID=A0ACD5UJC5_AVESA
MAMEAALVDMATGVLKPVLVKLAAMLDSEYRRFKGVHDDIRSLVKELEYMHAFLLKMSEEEEPDVQDQVWAAEVRELSYEMEDSIDDFMISIGDKDTKPDGFIEKIKHSLGKMRARRRIGGEIMKKQILEVSQRNARYKTRELFSNTRNATVDTRALAIFEHASKLVGIDEPKAEVIKLLTEGVTTHEQTKLVSIVGSGGMGKTTLANQVYRDLEEKFKCKAFISVSRNPDMTNILRTILAQLTPQGTQIEATNIQQLISEIRDYLANRRYFVVVDDIWDVMAWNVIKLAFPMTSSGSIIITTTRINDVSKSCCSYFGGNIYSIRPLNAMHSKQLFHTRLFYSEESCPPYLEEVSDQILKKCDGLPLAIIAISGLLANRERTEDLWNQVRDSIGRTLQRNPEIEVIMKILSLSYFDLPAYLKTCLLYLSIFPEDSFIGKTALIWRWIGERFIHQEYGHTAHEIGEMCFNELLNRNLIQPAETNEYGEVESCRVHDILLDFIISKSREENFVTFLSVPIPTTWVESKFIRRLCLQGVKQGNSTLLTTGLDLSHVRSMFGFSVQMPSLEKFRHLRVLNFYDFGSWEEQNRESIVRLFQLRYLSYRHIGITELPEQIGCLQCLEILDLRETNVKELPATIVNLRKLSHLLVSYGVKFPVGVAKMQALETLKMVSVSIQLLDFLSGLGQLKNLRNLFLDSYTYDGIEIGEEHNKAIVSSLCELGTQNLRSLTIQDNSGLLQLQVPLWQPPFEKLMNCYLAVPQIPKWASSLRSLQKLLLEVDGVKQDDICMLGALPTLRILHLREKTQSNELRISGEVGFQRLRIFIYDAKHHPVDHMFAAGSMPKLEKLVLICHVLEADSLDFGIENLPCLTTVRCEANGDLGIVEAVKTAMERAVSTHPNHPSLVFRHVNKT